jgi:hypothetical protein
MASMLDKLNPTLVCVICKKRKPITAYPKGSRVCGACRKNYQDDDDSGGGKQAREGIDADHKAQHEKNTEELKDLIEERKQDYIDKLDTAHDLDLEDKAKDALEKHLEKKSQDEKSDEKSVKAEPLESGRYGKEGLDQFNPNDILPDSPLHGDFEKLWIADPRGLMVLNMLNHYFGQFAQIHSHLMTADRDTQANLGFIAYTDGGTYFTHMLNGDVAPQSAQASKYQGAQTQSNLGNISVNAHINTTTHTQMQNANLQQSMQNAAQFQATNALNGPQQYNTNHSQFSRFATASALAFLGVKPAVAIALKASGTMPQGSLFQKAPKEINKTTPETKAQTSNASSMFKGGLATADMIENAAKQATKQVLNFMRSRSGK